MKAVVLAAGEGVRLRPLTDNRPKQLIPIAGRPILEHLIRNLAACDISEILLVVGAKKDSIQGFFGDGKSFGVRLSYVVQPAVLGTAHAIGMARGFAHNERFLALYGDICVQREAFRRILVKLKEDSSATLMTVVPVSAPQFFGIAKVEQGQVTSLVEKPSSEETPGNLVNAGVFAFPPEIFEAIEKTGKSERGEFEITESLNLLIHRGSRVKAIQLDPETWKDIGRPWNILEANEIALKDIRSSVQGEVDDGARLTGPVVIEKGSHVRSGSYIEGPVLISAGAEIGPNCYIRPFTSIGRNVRIGNGCEIKNSMIMNDTRIPHLSYVGDSIIGERCNLGAGTIIANLRLDEEPVKMMISGNLVSTGRRKLGAVLGDDVQTGINVSIMPGVKIGSNSFIGPSMAVSRDVPQNGRLA